MLFSALASVTMLSDTAIGRMYDYLASCEQLTVTLGGGLVGGPETLKAEYWWVWPNRQNMVFGSGPGRTEFRQRGTTILAIEHGRRAYQEFLAPDRIVNPPSEYVAVSALYPSFLVLLKSQGKGKIPLEDKGTREVEGVTLDYVQIPPTMTPEGEAPPVDLFLDTFGRIVRIHYIAAGLNGPENRFLTYKNIDTGRRAVTMPAEIEKGYVPDVIPSKFYTAGPGERVQVSEVTDARSGKTVDFAARVKGKRFAILFTATDCEPSKRGEAVWKNLRVELAKKDCPLFEVVVDGGKIDLAGKDKDRPVFVDKSGRTTEYVSPPVTPYIVVVESNEAMVKAWAGYGKDQDKRLVKTLVGAFDSE